MSEVKLNTPAISTGHPDAGRVYAAAYEAAVVAHDAQRLRADTAEAELAEMIDNFNIAVRQKMKLAKELSAAEQCIAELTDLLTGVVSDTARWMLPGDLHERIRAALNPNPEVESHE